MMSRFSFSILGLLALSIFAWVTCVECEELWYAAYDIAMKAIESGNWTLAAEKLNVALAQQSADQKKKVRTYGVRTKDYFPDFWLGVAYFNLNQYEKAESQFKKAEKLNLAKESPELYSRVSDYRSKMKPSLPKEDIATLQTLLGQEKFEDFTKLLSNLNRRYPGNQTLSEFATRLRSRRDSLIQEARSLIDRRDLQQALSKLATARRIDAQNAQISELSSQVAKWQEAEVLLTKAKESFTRKQFQSAKDDLKAASDRDPANPRILDIRREISEKESGLADLVEEAVSLTQINGARKILLEAQTTDSGNGLYAEWLGRLDQKEKLLLDKTARDKAIVMFKDLVAQSNQAMNSGEYSRARELASRAATLQVDDQKTISSVIKKISAKEFSDLIEKAGAALQSRKFATARELVQRAQQTGGDSKGAAKVMAKKIDIEEGISLFEVAKRNKDIQGAQQAFQTVRTRDPNNKVLAAMAKWIDDATASLTADQKQQLALLAFYSGMYENSANLLAQIEMQNKTSAEVYFYLGCSYAAQGLLKGNKATVEKAAGYFARVWALDQNFRYDDRFISPRISNIFRKAQPSSATIRKTSS